MKLMTLGLALFALSGAACSSPKTEPSATTPSAAHPSAAAPSTASNLGTTPVAHPKTPSDRWRRAAEPEPDPEAKALYRRGMDLMVAGQLPEAQRLFKQIQREHPNSRFAVRLTAVGGRAGGPLALLASLAGMLAVASQE